MTKTILEIINKIPQWIISVILIIFMGIILEQLYISKRPVDLWGFKLYNLETDKNTTSIKMITEEVIKSKLFNQSLNKKHFFDGIDENNISISFILSNNQKLADIYFLHKGYNVKSSSSKINKQYKEKFHVKVAFNYDLSKEEISKVFTDLDDFGLLNITCVEPVSWHSGIKHIEVFTINDNHKCNSSQFAKDVTNKELSMLRNTKYQNFNPKYGILNKKENTSAYFLQLNKFRKSLKLGNKLKNEKMKKTYEEVRYGK